MLHEWGHGAVAKVLRRDIPPHWAEREAVTTELVRAAGLPAPTVLDLVDVDGCPAIVFERVDGPTMLDEVVRRPQEREPMARELARLQRLVTGCPAPASLPRLHDRIAANVAAAVDLDPGLQRAALHLLASLPHGTAVCHFDLHPNNVLLGPSGPIVIDWFDAASGDPAADVVRTSVLLRRELGHGHLDDAPANALDAVRTAYLREVADLRATDPGWEPVVLASRVAEPVGVVARAALSSAMVAAVAALPTPVQALVTPAPPSAPAR